MGVRNADFYRAVSSLPSTYLVPLERDTFELIDSSVAVATITGTVGLEALCRGKRVIVFGEANYTDFAGVMVIDARATKSDLATFVLENHDPSSTEQDLVSEALCSVGPDAEDNSVNFQSQQSAVITAFQYIARSTERLLCGSRVETQ
jgi:hypothetical protein